MGCAHSKIENEETVLRCKERRRHMREGVTERNAFAAAHSAFAMSLKNTGGALSDYAQGEISSSSTTTTTASALLPSAAASQPHYEIPLLVRPPPPLPEECNPLQRAASMPEMKSVHHRTKGRLSETVIEEGEEGEGEEEAEEELRHRPSRSSGGGVGGGGFPVGLSPPQPPRLEGDGVLDYIFADVGNMAGPSLAKVDHEGTIEMEEIERHVTKERSRRADHRVNGSSGGSRRGLKAEGAENLAERPPQPPTKVPKRAKPPAAVVEGKRGGKGAASINMFQIFNQLDDCFLKASESATEVSKMLEANRLHYHSNFADNRGHIDHSARVLRVITWNKSFRGFPNVDDRLDDFDSEENETHATVLDKMLAWEKKLYDEVKAGEQMRIEYQRKVASLSKLKKHGASTESIEKAKATLSHLHTRYIVDMQSMDSTVSEINRLRDEQLYPKLVALVDGMAKMWESMKEQHESQKKISTALRSLDISQSTKATTNDHYERTVQLGMIVQAWHSQLHKLITHQKTYIKALNDWLRLNLVPLDTNLKEKVSSPESTQSPPIQALLHSWQDQLEKLPAELAISGITSFEAVVRTIVQFQADEIKLRDKCEHTQKELDRKTRQFEDWHDKYMQKRTPPDEVDPDRSEDKELVAERRMTVEIVRQRLEEEQKEYERQCRQVRDKSLAALRNQLPELFRALSEFSNVCFHMYTYLWSITRPMKPNQSSQ